MSALPRHEVSAVEKVGESCQVCIHCRRGLVECSQSGGQSSLPALVCTYTCPYIFGTTDKSLSGSKCFLSVQQSHSLSTTYRLLEGWGKQLQFFLASSQAFVVLGLVLILLPTFTMSNPLPSTSGESSRSSSGQTNDPTSTSHHRHEREQKWINPCRIPPSIPTANFAGDNEIQMQLDQEIFHNIIIQANKAEAQALEFFKQFYRDAFGGDPEESDRYERLTYDFLSDVMDQVNNQLIDEHFSTLQVDETIRMMYQGLQKFAVGLEAIVLDQACYGGSYYHHFNEAEFQLKYVLCELQIAMLEKNISHNDITREIMSTEYRDLADKTTRYIRDWTIFRDYVKTLRYVRHAFQYFRNRAIATEQSGGSASASSN